MSKFIGTHDCTVDSKGRVLLPSSIKKQLQSVVHDGFVLKRSVFYNCLELYPMDEWNKEVEHINGLNRFVKKHNDFIRLFMAGVKFIELDGSGRLLITKDLLQFAGIEKDITLASSVNKIEIWDSAKYEAIINDKSIDFGSLAEEVMGKLLNNDNSKD